MDSYYHCHTLQNGILSLHKYPTKTKPNFKIMAKLTKVASANTTLKGNNWWGSGLVAFALVVVLIALLVVLFETVAYPMHEFGKPMLVAGRENAGSLSGLEKIGLGELIGAEDIAYDRKSGVVYTGCEDGWIKRVMLNYSVVENWVHTGGRPLGIAIGDVFVADAFKGLLKVSVDGELELLTDEVEGVKLGLTDGIVVAKNGMVYFTDATYKYGLHQWFHEGRPHGRLLSYDPSTKQTQVIVRDLYFANGVQLSSESDQDFVIFCESFMRKCRRYYLQGERKGSVDVFINNLPDNIWFAMAWDNSFSTKFIQTYIHSYARYLHLPTQNA